MVVDCVRLCWLCWCLSLVRRVCWESSLQSDSFSLSFEMFWFLLVWFGLTSVLVCFFLWVNSRAVSSLQWMLPEHKYWHFFVHYIVTCEKLDINRTITHLTRYFSILFDNNFNKIKLWQTLNRSTNCINKAKNIFS